MFTASVLHCWRRCRGHFAVLEPPYPNQAPLSLLCTALLLFNPDGYEKRVVRVSFSPYVFPSIPTFFLFYTLSTFLPWTPLPFSSPSVYNPVLAGPALSFTLKDSLFWGLRLLHCQVFFVSGLYEPRDQIISHFFPPPSLFYTRLRQHDKCFSANGSSLSFSTPPFQCNFSHR